MEVFFFKSKSFTNELFVKKTAKAVAANSGGLIHNAESPEQDSAVTFIKYWFSDNINLFYNHHLHCFGEFLTFAF